MTTTLLSWWQQLNIALAVRGEPGATYGEIVGVTAGRPAWRSVDPREPRIVNVIINRRKAP
jgi:hypothetical protein